MDKIILVHYVAVGHKSPSKTREYIQHYMEVFDSKDDGIISYIIPTRDENTRLECINPKLVTPAEFDDARRILDRAKEAALVFIHRPKKSQASQ